MNSLNKLLLLMWLLMPNVLFAQVANHVVIAEVYGGGGNSGSFYICDYIVLYNPTSQNVDLSAWSVQYTSAIGNSWKLTNLSGNINANSYYAIQEDSGSSGSELPFIPNVVGTINIAATGGKVALVNNQIALTDTMPGSNASIVDFVGYGGANGYEGTGPAPAPSNTKSIRRRDNSGGTTYGSNGSGYDTDDNSADFFTATTDNTAPPLPVELVSFEAFPGNGSIRLKWRTATEVNNYGFDIERVADPVKMNWIKIGFIKGNGNSNVTHNYTFEDKGIKLGEEYFYRLKQIDADGNFQYSNVIASYCKLPDQIVLLQNYPNPFNPSTSIKIYLPQSDYITLKIFNNNGEEVKTLFIGNKVAGEYEFSFKAGALASGVYFVQLCTEKLTLTKKMLLLK